jgi:signal transduction histidine kinase
LGVVIVALVASILIHEKQFSSATVAKVGSALATGLMIGTVMLYIHRANRDAAIKARLLRELDDAHRDLAARAREAGVQEERRRLARDIHDTLAQGFSSVIQHLEATELSVNANALSDDTRSHLQHARDVSRASLAEIRRLVWALQPPQLADATLVAALERIVKQWSEVNGIPVATAFAEMPALTPDADVVFLRATQELLSNVARHAQAKHVAATLACVDGLAMLTIEDDGVGFDESIPPGEQHYGLRGMRERVRPFGGQALVESAAGKGTNVTIALPLTAITRES